MGFYGDWSALSPISVEGGDGAVFVDLVPGTVDRPAVASAPALVIPTPRTEDAFVLPKVRPVVSSPRLQPKRQQAVRPVTQTAQMQPADPCANGACNGGAGGGTTSEVGNGVPSASALTAVRTPKPPYPWAARRDGFEGRVVLDILVAANGRVRDAWVKQSSGRVDCDRSALQTVREEWAFRPLSLAGVPIESRSRIVVVYELENS